MRRKSPARPRRQGPPRPYPGLMKRIRAFLRRLVGSEEPPAPPAEDPADALSDERVLRR